MSTFEGIKNNVLRRRILEALKAEYPGAVDLMALRIALDSAGVQLTSRQLNAQVAYLHEGGFVKHENPAEGVSFAALTKHGWDILDELLEDRGISH